MNFNIRSAPRPEEDFKTWSLEELESEHFSLMMTSGFAIPARAQLIQQEIDSRRSKKINLSSLYGKFGEGIKGGMGGGFKRDELAVISSGTTSLAKLWADEITREIDKEIVDQMLAYDKVLMSEFEQQFLNKPMPVISKQMVDAMLDAHSLGIKHQYYVPPKSYTKKVSTVGLVNAPTGFVKAPDENWSSMRLKEAVDRMVKTQQDMSSFFDPGRATREHIMNDDIRFMYPTTIRPVSSLINMDTTALRDVLPASKLLDTTIEWAHAEANCFKSDIKMEILKERSAAPGIITMMYDTEATADFSKLQFEVLGE